MRKSMIATAVVAAAVSASANAGYWTLAGMNYQNGGSPITVGSGNGTLGNTTAASPVVGGAANTLTVNASTANILTALSISLAVNELTYFGFETSTTGPGYFGVAYKAGIAGAITLNFSSGINAAGGSQGVLATQATSNFGGNGSFGGFGDFSGAFAVANSSTLVVLFGGLAAGDGFTLDVTRAAGAATMGGVRYLSYNGSSYTTFATTGAATKSGLNTALYAVPVPAPALLAGAGLVGAAALRRRMTKKA